MLQKQREPDTSPSLWAIGLLIQPRMGLVSFIPGAHCWLAFAGMSTRLWAPSPYCCLGLFQPMCLCGTSFSP